MSKSSLPVVEVAFTKPASPIDPALAPNTIGFVVPRYGPDVLGGAETLLRGLAEHLHRAGYPVQVLTTCTNSLHVWNNHYPAGPTLVNGVPTIYFPSDQVDMDAYHRVAGKALRGGKLSYAEQQTFVQNSINSQPLYRYLEANAANFKAVVFGPYLFGTTYWGAKAVPGKAVTVPCFHDEVFAYFAIFGEMLAEAAGVVFNTLVERNLVANVLRYPNQHWATVGYGFERSVGDPARASAKYGLSGDLLLYAGRLDEAKNVPQLLAYFVRYQESHTNAIKLVLTGSGPVELPERPDIVALGTVPSADLPDIYAAATVCCQPSLQESFSIVIMEAWLQERPVLVHGDCEVTADHVERSGGGLCFRNYEEFAAALDQVFVERRELATWGQRGRAYVEANYSWPVVIERFVNALERFSAPRSLYSQTTDQALRHALNFSRERYFDQLESVLQQASQTHISLTQQGLAATTVENLRRSAQIGDPKYQPQSRLPVVGRLIVRLRQALTSHLREPYLDPIITRQQQHNERMIDVLLQSLDQQRFQEDRLARRIQRLENQLAHIQRTQRAVAPSAALPTLEENT